MPFLIRIIPILVLLMSLQPSSALACEHYCGIFEEIPEFSPDDSGFSPRGRDYPTDYFRKPLGIPLLLSGTFGELRTNHFHAGLDIKTQGTTGHNIYAAAEGTISRIRVSPYGYGKAIYIDHPNGYTTVYGHLSKFNEVIGNYVRTVQAQNESYVIDVELPPGLIQVTKGEVVALSGNSGSSGGPHLHFEIRDTWSEHPINPLLFGIKVKDTRKPIFTGLYLYNLDEQARPYTDKKTMIAKPSGGSYVVAPSTVVLASPRCGIAANVYDQLNGASNKNGIYSLKLEVDGEQKHYMDVETWSFDESRYLNAHIDYELYRSKKRRINKCFTDPGNQLSIYQKDYENGIVDLSDQKTHAIKITATDIAGNKSTLNFKLRWDPTKEGILKHAAHDQVLSYGVPHYIEKEEIRAHFPASAFYNDVFFNYGALVSKHDRVYSKKHQLHSSKTAVHVPYQMWIKQQEMPQNLREKSVIVSIDDRGGRDCFTNTSWEGDWCTAEVKGFGEFYITTDTQAPTIKSQAVYSGRDCSKYKRFWFKIKDELTGIKDYKGKIDGKWVLMEYDYRNQNLMHYFEKDLAKGEHHFELIVTDHKDNEKRLSFTFKR